MACKVRNRIRVCLWLAVLVTALPQFALAQYGQTPGDLLDTFRAVRPNWFTAAAGAANRLFGLLALIEFAWTAVILVLDKSDLQGWTAALVRRMMFVGAFLALLVNGPIWIPAIIDSFAILGQNAAGIGGAGLSPGDVFVRGLQIAANLGESASIAGFFVNPASALALVLAAVLTFLAFVVISVHFIMALVESYVVVGAGFIFLGFGGSRWTAPYVERYIALAVAVGVKLMVLYMLVGAGMTLSAAWTARALSAAAALSPIMEALDIMGGAIIFGILCWQAPKFTASLLGGSPNFSGGDIAAVGLAGAQAGIAVATLGAGAVKLLAARGAAAGGAMAVNQAASMGGGSAGGSGMMGNASVASAASGGQSSAAAGTGGASGGNGGNGSGGSNGSNGGVGFGSGGNQPKPPTLGGGNASANSPATSVSGSPAGTPRSNGTASSAPAPSSPASPVERSAATTHAASSASVSSAPAVQGDAPQTAPPRIGGLGVAAAVASRRNPAPPVNGGTDSQQSSQATGSTPPTEATGLSQTSIGHGSMDAIAGVAAGVSGTHAPVTSGIAADAVFAGSGNSTLESPQTLQNPQTVSEPMMNASPMTTQPDSSSTSPSNVVYASFGNRPANQPAPPPVPAENATLENPQTITNPQTVSSPMTNSSPMAVNTAQVPKPPTGSPMEKLANAAEIAEQALDRSGRLAQGLRQALPPDGSGGGGPAQLNLHGGE
jgi:type IV secretion system protein TrbL